MIETNKVTFENIIGYEEEKKEILEIREYILEYRKYEEIGARVPKGILLLGESGNGKTLMIKALANELNIPLFKIGQDEDENENLLYIRKIFKEARQKAPAIIFIDEIDKLCAEDDLYSLTQRESNVTRELLMQMDGFESNKSLIVIATANSVVKINPSLLRSGRFDKVINFRYPNYEERKQLFQYYSKQKKLSINIDFDRLAKVTSGFSCADIDNVLNDAAILAVRNKINEVDTSDVETAIDRLTTNSATISTLSDEEKKKIAIHEIGHAIVAMNINDNRNVHKISIVSRGQILGQTKIISPNEYEVFGLTTKESMMNKIKILYGGLIAEELYLKDITTGSSRDIEMARYTVEVMVKKFGMVGVINSVDSSMRMKNNISQHKIRKTEKIQDKILKKCYKETKKIIKKHKEIFNKLYQKLIVTNVLFKEDIEQIINSK